MRIKFLIALICCGFLMLRAEAQAYRNYFAEENAEWLIMTFSDMMGNIESYSLHTQSLENVEGYSDLKVMMCSVFCDDSTPLYLSTEGDKVYFQPSPESSERYLMYDFSIQEGETVEVWSAGEFLRSGELHKSRMECVSVTPHPENPEIKVIELTEFLDIDIPEGPWVALERWYAGIGSSRLPQWNSRFQFLGLGVKVCRFKAEGETIFDLKDYVENTSVGSIPSLMDSDEAAYYTLQGERVYSPRNGIYIRLQNGESQKVLIP